MSLGRTYRKIALTLQCVQPVGSIQSYAGYDNSTVSYTTLASGIDPNGNLTEDRITTYTCPSLIMTLFAPYADDLTTTSFTYLLLQQPLIGL